MAVKIFAKISYNINGVASPSMTHALAWVDELNKLDSDTRKISSFLGYQSLPFFMGTPIQGFSPPDAMANDFPIDKSPDEVFSMFGFVENENYPFDKYMRTVGFIGNDMTTGKLAFIMNNLAYDTSDGDDNSEPAKVFFYIHKLTTAEIDSFADSHPALNTVNASVTDLYDLLLPCIATKNGALEADGYRQATQNGNSIVFYADSIAYYNAGVFTPEEIS